jgi:hypothetical protein
MWGKRKKRRGQLPRQLALGRLEAAMGRVQQPREPEDSEPTIAAYPGSVPAPAAPPARADLRAADVPVDNSAGPRPAEPPVPPQGEVPAQRTGESTRHGTLGDKNHFRVNGNLQAALS